MDANFRSHPAIAALATRHGAVLLDGPAAQDFCSAPGTRLLACMEEPARRRETLDLAVIVGEIARAFSGAFTLGVPDPETATALQPRFGFRRWPAIVLLRDGALLGAIDGLRTWDEYVTGIEALLTAEPSRRQGPGIPIVVADATTTTPRDARSRS